MALLRPGRGSWVPMRDKDEEQIEREAEERAARFTQGAARIERGQAMRDYDRQYYEPDDYAATTAEGLEALRERLIRANRR